MHDTPEDNITTTDFPATAEVFKEHTSDFHLPPFESLVEMRVTQIVNGFGLLADSTLSEDDLRKSGLILRAVAVAYKLGMKDGLTRLGDLA